MIDRGGQAAEVGRLLLMHAEIVFGWWHWVREGRWQRATFQRRLPWLRRSLRAALEGGTWSPCVQTEATCRELLRVEPALWTFVRVEGMELTNKAAERSLRHAVHWRKVSYGTQSEQGSRFVAHILTVVASGQQQGRNILVYLTACCQAFYTRGTVPSLLPQTSS